MAKRKPKIVNAEEPAVVVPEPKVEPKAEPVVEKVTTETAPKTPKKRIRIRKKATKKLSAAIICMDPTVQRFI
jgi:hypothetical protein